MKPNVDEVAAESSHQSSKCALLFIITILSPRVNDHQCFITRYHLDNFSDCLVSRCWDTEPAVFWNAPHSLKGRGNCESMELYMNSVNDLIINIKHCSALFGCIQFSIFSFRLLIHDLKRWWHTKNKIIEIVKYLPFVSLRGFGWTRSIT